MRMLDSLSMVRYNANSVLQVVLLVLSVLGIGDGRGVGSGVELRGVGESSVDCARVPSPLCDGDVFSWCNMPHVRADKYLRPAPKYTLEYVEVIHRHHKRTPYSSNIFPREDAGWSCNDAGVLLGMSVPSVQGPDVALSRRNDFNDANPFRVLDTTGFPNSSCQFPQLTKEGFEDSIAHGSDLRKVYAPLLDLSPHYDPSNPDTTFRITNNVITSQVASGFLKGFYPSQFSFSSPFNSNSNPIAIPVSIQPSSIDSLEPTYSCPRANSLREYFTTGINGSVWRTHLVKAQEEGMWSALDGVSGVPGDDRGWHANFDHYFDNLSGKQCHSRPLPCNLSNRTMCISQELANRVYDTGHWEYSYLYREAPGALEYSALKFGAWMLELKARLDAKIRGSNKIKYAHNIAHDGSISSLLGFLQVERMAWPGMGSEVVFELYRAASQTGNDDWSIRILFSGQPIHTASPLGTADMLPIQAFFDYIDSTVGSGSELYNRCFSAL